MCVCVIVFSKMCKNGYSENGFTIKRINIGLVKKKKTQNLYIDRHLELHNNLRNWN